MVKNKIQNMSKKVIKKVKNNTPKLLKQIENELQNPKKPLGEKERLMEEIKKATINFSKLSQKGITKKERNDFIDQTIQKIRKIKKMKLKMNEKILMYTTENVLSKMKLLEIKK